MSNHKNIWVYSDTASRLPEIIAGGLQLGQSVSAFIIGGQQDIAHAFASGASTVYHLGDKDSGKIIEDYAATMAQTIAQGNKPALVLLAATKRGKALAAKLGVQLQAGVVNEATQISVDEQSVKARHMVYGGLAFGEEKITSEIAIVSVGSGVFEAGAADTGASGQTISVTFIEPKAAIKCIERRAKQAGSVDLGKAKRVVGIGRGIAKQEDIAMAEQLCAAMGAELGCSRPIAEGEKWMERERYIGVSGVMLKPELYLALGISGQIQHMVGVNSAQTIIAINKDKNAPIFQYADYGLVGDIYKAVPALIAALKG
jgi:Electron transfer flavoprotein, alpha subunit